MAIINAYAEREDLGGGRFRLTQYLRPIAFDKPGVGWRRIVSDWADGDALEPHIVTEAKLRVRTAANGDRRILPVPADDNAWFSISSPYIKIAGVWTQPSLGTFSRSGNLLQAVSTNVNTYISHAGHYIKAGFLLKNGWTPQDNQFAFRVGLNGLTRSGGNLLYNGETVMHVRPPVVYDLDNQDDTRPIAWEFVQIGGNTYILFTLPSLVGMAKPLVDPTLSLQPDETDGIDTYTQEDAADTNYETSTLINVRSAAGSRRIGLLKFDLSSIPAGATVDSGTFSIWNLSTVAADRHFNLFSILVANSAWTEAGATWNFAVASTTRWAGDTGADGGTDAGCSVSGTDYNASALGTILYTSSTAVDTEHQSVLTVAQVQSWVDGSNYGFNLIATDAAGGWSWRSSSYATAAARPKLVVVYSVDLSVSSSESIGVAESVSLAISDTQVAVSDAIGVTESAPVTTVYNIAVSDSVTVLEGYGSIQDSVGVAESVSASIEEAGGDLSVNKSESIGVAESAGAVISDAQVSVSESITVSDYPRWYQDLILVDEDVRVDLQIDIATSENIGVAESIDFTGTYSLSLAENVAVTEQVTAVIPDDLQIATSESIGVAEAIDALQVSDVAASDAISVAENIAATVSDPQTSAAEAIGVGEAVNLLQISDVATAESVVIAESTSAAVSDPQVSASENVSVSETVESLLVSDIGIAETVGVAEAAGATISDPQVTAAENVTAAEGVSVLLPEAGAFSISVSDPVSVAESVGASVSDLAISVSDSIGVAETSSADLTIAAAASDTISIAENAAAETGALQASAAEAVSITESLGLLAEFFVNVSETISLGESVAAAVEATIESNISVSDAVGVGEAVAVDPLEISVSAIETIGVTESIAIGPLGLVISVAESVALAESLGLLAELFAGVADTVGVVDSAGLMLALDISTSQAIAIAELISVGALGAPGRVTISDALRGRAAITDSLVGNVTISDRDNG